MLSAVFDFLASLWNIGEVLWVVRRFAGAVTFNFLRLPDNPDMLPDRLSRAGSAPAPALRSRHAPRLPRDPDEDERGKSLGDLIADYMSDAEDIGGKEKADSANEHAQCETGNKRPRGHSDYNNSTDHNREKESQRHSSERMAQSDRIGVASDTSDQEIYRLGSDFIGQVREQVDRTDEGGSIGHSSEFVSEVNIRVRVGDRVIQSDESETIGHASEPISEQRILIGECGDAVRDPATLSDQSECIGHTSEPISEQRILTGECGSDTIGELATLGPPVSEQRDKSEQITRHGSARGVQDSIAESDQSACTCTPTVSSEQTSGTEIPSDTSDKIDHVMSGQVDQSDRTPEGASEQVVQGDGDLSDSMSDEISDVLKWRAIEAARVWESEWKQKEKEALSFILPPLSDEVLLRLFAHLRIEDLVSAGQTCRQWRRVARDEELWERPGWGLLSEDIGAAHVARVLRFAPCLHEMRASAIGSDWFCRKEYFKAPAVLQADIKIKRLTDVDARNDMHNALMYKHKAHLEELSLSYANFNGMEVATSMPLLRALAVEGGESTFVDTLVKAPIQRLDVRGVGVDDMVTLMLATYKDTLEEVRVRVNHTNIAEALDGLPHLRRLTVESWPYPEHRTYRFRLHDQVEHRQESRATLESLDMACSSPWGSTVSLLQAHADTLTVLCLHAVNKRVLDAVMAMPALQELTLGKVKRSCLGFEFPEPQPERPARTTARRPVRWAPHTSGPRALRLLELKDLKACGAPLGLSLLRAHRHSLRTLRLRQLSGDMCRLLCELDLQHLRRLAIHGVKKDVLVSPTPAPAPAPVAQHNVPAAVESPAGSSVPGAPMISEAPTSSSAESSETPTSSLVESSKPSETPSSSLVESSQPSETSTSSLVESSQPSETPSSSQAESLESSETPTSSPVESSKPSETPPSAPVEAVPVLAPVPELPMSPATHLLHLEVSDTDMAYDLRLNYSPAVWAVVRSLLRANRPTLQYINILLRNLPEEVEASLVALAGECKRNLDP